MILKIENDQFSNRSRDNITLKNILLEIALSESVSHAYLLSALRKTCSSILKAFDTRWDDLEWSNRKSNAKDSSFIGRLHICVGEFKPRAVNHSCMD